GGDPVPRPGGVPRVADRPALAAQELPGADRNLPGGIAAGLPRPEHRLRPAAHGHAAQRGPVQLPRPPADALALLSPDAFCLGVRRYSAAISFCFVSDAKKTKAAE